MVEILRTIVLAGSVWLAFVCVGTLVLVVKALFQRWRARRKGVNINAPPSEQKGVDDDSTFV